MTANVVGQSGKTVEVATLADVSGEAKDIPVATSSTAGVVKVGTNISVESDGTISVPTAAGTTQGVVSIGTGISVAEGELSVANATTTVVGGVLKASQVSDVETTTVTDITTAATAIAQLGTTLSELMQSLRNAGILDSGS